MKNIGKCKTGLYPVGRWSSEKISRYHRIMKPYKRREVDPSFYDPLHKIHARLGTMVLIVPNTKEW